MIKENSKCFKDRVISSLNPFLNDFNLVYKDIPTRLPVFEDVTSEQTVVEEYLRIEAQI